MSSNRFQERYVEKDNKVFDTWKNIPISRELDRYSLSHIISHLNGLGEIIDRQIEQGQYMMKKYYGLKSEKMTGKLSDEYGEYLCGYCCYRQPLGHCQYYRGSYSLKGSKGDVE